MIDSQIKLIVCLNLAPINYFTNVKPYIYLLSLGTSFKSIVSLGVSPNNQ